MQPLPMPPMPGQSNATGWTDVTPDPLAGNGEAYSLAQAMQLMKRYY
jgi:hypothetical protein